MVKFSSTLNARNSNMNSMFDKITQKQQFAYSRRRRKGRRRIKRNGKGKRR